MLELVLQDFSSISPPQPSIFVVVSLQLDGAILATITCCERKTPSEMPGLGSTFPFTDTTSRILSLGVGVASGSGLPTGEEGSTT